MFDEFDDYNYSNCGWRFDNLRALISQKLELCSGKCYLVMVAFKLFISSVFIEICLFLAL